MDWKLGAIPRADMPQIKSTLREEFLVWSGLDYSREAMFDLSPSQGEMSEDNILALMGKPEQLEKPLLVSRDGYVLDGHHRWAACSRLGQPVNCIVIDAGAAEALDLMAAFGSLHREECARKGV